MIAADSLLDHPLERAPLAVLDVETTGLAPRAGDRIVEIAVLAASGAREVLRFSSLVDPERPGDPRATAVHGITDAMLRGQPRFADIAPRILALLEGRILLGHNVRFDLGFLRAECERAGITLPPLVALDTLAFARARCSYPRNGLGALARELGIVQTDAHRAQGDVITTWRVFLALAEGARGQGIATVRDWFVAQGSAGERTRADTARRATSGVPAPPALLEAIERGGRLVLLYATASGLITRRVVRPLELTPPYLRAFCELRGEERTFRVDRIAELVRIVE